MLTPHDRILVWNSWGLFGLVALVLCTTMGVFVRVTRPDRAQNRRLALVLFIEGIVTAAGQPGTAFAGSDATARVMIVVHFVALFLIMPFLLRFVATIDTPLARPLATRGGTLLPWAIVAIQFGLLIVRPGGYIQGFRVPWWGGREFVPGPAATAAYTLSSLAPLYSLVVAISGYRRAAAGTAAKERARRYAIAFGVNDALIVFVTTIVPGVYAALHVGADLRPILFLYVWAPAVIETLFVVLMAYGILRTQLFDIDLKIAAGLRRGTVAAIVLFTFFAAAELAKQVVSQEFGYVVGALAAAALVLAHKPVERFAAGFSNVMLPGASASPEYLVFRKFEVYLDAAEAAYEDGRLSKEDRVILKRLQAKLEISPVDAERLEADAGRARNLSVMKRMASR